jgi:hypothetical protein
MGRAVMDQVQAAARKESELIQMEIEAGLQAEVARLIDFRGRLETELNAVQLSFRPDPQDPDPGIALTAGAGMISSALGGWLVGGVLGGAFTGYQLAGFRGAATGAAVGAAAGFGAATAGGLIIAALGLPLTWPVLLPTLAIAGLASAFGARWFTRAIFGGEAVDRFRERFREAVLAQLEASSAQRVAEVERATEHQVTEAFGALRRQVENELGGLILQTQRTLDDLRARRSRSEAQREHETSSLAELSQQAAQIEARQLRIAEGLRGQEQQP